MVLSTKTKAGASETRQDMMKALEGSLKRLKTDYVDIYFNHAVNDVARMRNQEWWEFTAQAKQQGKIRFRGMSGHGSGLVECLDYAIDQDLVDVILVSYTFAQDPTSPTSFATPSTRLPSSPICRRCWPRPSKRTSG